MSTGYIAPPSFGRVGPFRLQRLYGWDC